MEQYYGLFVYGLSLLTMGGIYGVMALGLNVQWGFTGLFNAGIAGFFAVGAYVQAILTTPICRDHLGCYDVPIPLAMLVAMVFSAAVAWAIARITSYNVCYTKLLRRISAMPIVAMAR